MGFFEKSQMKMSSFIQCSREWRRREEGGGRERGKERESQEEYERGKAREGGARAASEARQRQREDVSERKSSAIAVDVGQVAAFPSCL